MRLLRFKISGQNIKKDPFCNFEKIVFGTKNYLIAEFSFDKEWKKMNKVAVFKCLNKEYPILIVEGKCIVPSNALIWKRFSLYVVGQNKSGVRIRTNSIFIEQEVG